MAATPDQIIENLLSTIDNAIGDFNKSLPDIQKQAFAKVIKLTAELELSNGRIKPTVANIRIFNRIKKELENTIISKPYLKSLDEYVASFNAVDSANGKYFSSINEKYSPGTVFGEIKKQMIDETISSLTESGIGERITKPIQNILRTNIVSGAHYEDLVNDMREFLTDTRNGEGALVKYSRQITTDAINQYNANYNQIATSDLGLVWYKYVGSLIRTSREFCIRLIDAKKSCMEYIHFSQFDELVRGEICGEQIHVNEKTDLPDGMIPGTTPETLLIRRGGFNCAHQFYPVSSSIVPEKTIQNQNQFEVFERQPVKGQDVRTQEKAIRYFVSNKESLIKDYLKANGKTIDTDAARLLFKPVGYKGTNAQAVHEASSILGKEAEKILIKLGTQNKVGMYAGGAGSGKTSAIEKLHPSIVKNSDAIIDGNLASYSKAAAKINNYIDNNKSVEIAYAYREPTDAWINGVVKRMLNPKSGGRVVTLKTFLENTRGSYDTIKQILSNNDIMGNEKFSLTLIDNSRGAGNASFINKSEFLKIQFDSDLKQQLINITKKMYADKVISKEQFDALLAE